jgi:hypothetical protein
MGFEIWIDDRRDADINSTNDMSILCNYRGERDKYALDRVLGHMECRIDFIT